MAATVSRDVALAVQDPERQRLHQLQQRLGQLAMELMQVEATLESRTSRGQQLTGSPTDCKML